VLDPHRANIYVHIVAGTVALAAGFGALLSVKGSPSHRKAGGWFLCAMIGICLTAVVGLAVFDFRGFLGMVTVLTAYTSFSGYRALALRGRRPERLDALLASALLAASLGFLAILPRLHLPWAPALTVNILVALLAWSTYDVLRLVLSERWLKRVWLHEHVAKMMASFLAVFGTFTATVFPSYQPGAAAIPAIAGTLWTLYVLWNLSSGSRPTQAAGNSNCAGARRQ
jgi:hypothetical protein